MHLRPTTPSGTPVPTLADEHPKAPLVWRRVGDWLSDRGSLIVEPLDPAGRISTLAFVVSTTSAAFAYAITLQLIHPYGLDWPVVHFLTRHLGGAAWAIACGAGFLSNRRLPRLLAGSIVATAACFYGWDRLGMPGRVFPWNFITHIALGLGLALPSLLAWARRRFHDHTA